MNQDDRIILAMVLLVLGTIVVISALVSVHYYRECRDAGFSVRHCLDQ